MTKRISLLLLLMAVIAATSATYAQKIDVKKGQKLETLTTTKMNMEMMGQNIDYESSTTSNVEVKDVSEAGYLFSTTVKHLTLKSNGMGQDMSFDSDKKEDLDGQMGQLLKGKLGVTQELQVDKYGKVADTKDKDTSAKKNGGSMSDMMSMSGDLSKGQPYPILIQLPAKAIKTGDTWTDSSGTTASIKTVVTYTLKAITAEGAVVSFAGTFAKGGTVEQNGMEIQVDLTGSTKGEATYETNSGLLKTNTSTSDLKGTLGIMGQNMPIAATINATVVAKKG